MSRSEAREGGRSTTSTRTPSTAYLALLDQLRVVDQAGFEAAMPGSFVDGNEQRADYPEVVWDYADQVAAGELPDGYWGGLGCEG
jgi:hypothetical protein